MLTPEQKERRRNSIGGSDAAPAVGLSPWKSQYELWAEKTGLSEPEDISDLDAVWWGSQLERLIGIRAKEQYGIVVRKSNVQHKHDKHEWMHANIDGRVQGKRQGVEIKTTSSFGAQDWGEEGSDQIPLHYLLQCLHYQIVTGLTELPWIVLLLIDGRHLRKYEIPFDRILAEQLVDQEHEFWTLVQTREQPEVKTATDVSLAWGQDNGQIVIADETIIGAHQELLSVRDTLKSLSATKDELELKIKKFMQENADLLITPDGATMATWRTSKPSRKFDAKAFKAAHPDLYEEFSQDASGVRRFLTKVIP